MTSIITIAGFWLLGIALGYCVGRLHTSDPEADALDQLAQAVAKLEHDADGLYRTPGHVLKVIDGASGTGGYPAHIIGNPPYSKTPPGDHL